MRLLLVDFADNKPVMDEIGRLRELTFRAVGEGTGQHKDLDVYDRYYRHLVLWDDAALEIAGAYRLGEVWRWQDLRRQNSIRTVFLNLAQTSCRFWPKVWNWGVALCSLITGDGVALIICGRALAPIWR